jgi:hypothetical protein
MTRLELVQQTLERLPQGHSWTMTTAMEQWWIDSRDQGGLRLSKHGVDAFRLAGHESWFFEIKKSTPFLPRTLLILNQHLECAYWLELKKTSGIEFFSSREATMYSLYQDINQFVRALGR